MIPTFFDVKAVAMPDPHPPLDDLNPSREVLVVQIAVRSPVAPTCAIILAGEALPELIALLQKVCAARPELTTERAAKEGVAVDGEDVGRVGAGSETKQ